jgi:hypothetical protein
MNCRIHGLGNYGVGNGNVVGKSNGVGKGVGNGNGVKNLTALPTLSPRGVWVGNALLTGFA